MVIESRNYDQPEQMPDEGPMQRQYAAAPGPGDDHRTYRAGQWRMLEHGNSTEKLPRNLDALWHGMVGKIQHTLPTTRRLMRQAQHVLAHEKRYHEMARPAMREAVDDLRAIFRRGRQKREDVYRAFALVRELAWRELGMRPYPVQVAAGLAIYHGYCAELATGEGKTLSATMPAVLAGWQGLGCHVITVNDYLAERDAHELKPLYSAAHLRVGHVISSMQPPQRRAGYAADVTYTTNKEVAADHLRDRLIMGKMHRLSSVLMNQLLDGSDGRSDRLVMRGLEVAIIDEADSVLIDEAVTPLIISGDAPNAEQVDAYRQAAQLAAQLEPTKHYKVNHRYREIDLTREGKRQLNILTHEMSGIWRGARRREELVTQALSARELFTRDQQYVIDADEESDEQKIVIVDEFTGRLMPDRTWRDGLHQAVEAKEDLEVNPPKATLARISFQRFFRMYRKLGGMTGTAWEARGEFWQIYRMPVTRIPTHRPCVRVHHPTQCFATQDAKWRAVVARIVELHLQGRPVLIGTRSVKNSEHLSAMLNEANLSHQVLNAVRHREEAQIVAQAGQPGRITVATNMAGRGTDIKLGKGVAQIGGLAVVATEPHESQRIDRQLIGRAARQGDPGSAELYIARDDELIQRYGPAGMKRIAQAHPKMIGRLADAAQQRAMAIAFRQRKGVLKQDEWLSEHLGFAGAEA